MRAGLERLHIKDPFGGLVAADRLPGRTGTGGLLSLDLKSIALFGNQIYVHGVGNLQSFDSRLRRRGALIHIGSQGLRNPYRDDVDLANLHDVGNVINDLSLHQTV